MKNVPTFKEFLVESKTLNESKYKGKKLYPKMVI